MEFEDPEVIQTVQQFLHEHGYFQTLKQLEQEVGLPPFDSTTIEMGHKLETVLNEYREHTLQRQLNQLEIDEKKSSEKLLEKGDGNFAKMLCKSFDNIHLGNILTIAFSHEKDSKTIATGSTDKYIKLTNYETKEKIAEFNIHNGPVISLAFNPVFTHLLLSSSMDGTHALIDTKQKKVLQTFKDHSKYVVFIRWSSNGLVFATASHDHSVAIYKATSIDSNFQLVDKSVFNSNPETIAFTKKGSLAIGLRDDNYVHMINLDTLEKSKFNLNAALDEHVSFTPMHVSYGEEDDYLLVSTDKDRLILYYKDNSTPVRTFWGASNDSFSNPRHSWDPSGRYVYSTSQDNRIYVWEVATQTIVHRLEGHTSVVRDLCYHPHEKILASCSFDKSVKLWIPQLE